MLLFYADAGVDDFKNRIAVVLHDVDGDFTALFIVIDGGTEGNADCVRQVIMENGGIVHAWFLTHPHPDHIGAFNQIYANPQGIHIGQI